MTIPYCIQIGDPLTAQEEVKIEEVILATFAEIHQVYNNWNPQAEISILNALKADEKIQLSSKLSSFLEFTARMVTLTEGRFDPTVAPLHKAWKNAIQTDSLPSPEEIATLAKSVGWEKIHLEGGFFWKEDSLTALDLGGIAKGYGVDLLTEKLQNQGYSNLYVEWGGEIRTCGLHPQKRPWKVGILGDSPLELKESSLATSGSYIQYWSVDGTTYTHIIDPRSKLPLHDGEIQSATISAPTCAEADAIATALMLFPTKEAAQAWAKERGYSVWIW